MDISKRCSKAYLKRHIATIVNDRLDYIIAGIIDIISGYARGNLLLLLSGDYDGEMGIIDINNDVMEIEIIKAVNLSRDQEQMAGCVFGNHIINITVDQRYKNGGVKYAFELIDLIIAEKKRRCYQTRIDPRISDIIHIPWTNQLLKVESSGLCIASTKDLLNDTTYDSVRANITYEEQDKSWIYVPNHSLMFCPLLGIDTNLKQVYIFNEKTNDTIVVQKYCTQEGTLSVCDEIPVGWISGVAYIPSWNGFLLTNDPSLSWCRYYFYEPGTKRLLNCGEERGPTTFRCVGHILITEGRNSRINRYDLRNFPNPLDLLKMLETPCASNDTVISNMKILSLFD